MSDLTPRENFIRYFKNEPIQWMPSVRDILRFNPDCYPDNIARGVVNEVRACASDRKGGKDLFGVPWVFDPTAPGGGGSMEAPGFRALTEVSEWRGELEMTPLDSLDWAGAAARNADYLKTDKIVCSTIYTSFFERLISLVGFEDAAIAMVDEDECDEVKALFDALADYYIDLIGRMHKYFNTELIYMHDDWGSQMAPMISLGVHREIIAPYVKKVADAAHKMGVFIEMHSCGQIEALIPSIVETGVDTWRGQWGVNDKYALVKKYGRQFKFGVDIIPQSADPSLAAPSDDEALAIARDFVEKYRGENVWLGLQRGFTPAQLEMMYGCIYAGFGQTCAYRY